MIGLEKGTVRLLAYQADWPSLFQAEADRLRGVLGDRISVIEHHGSTAIPGMPAKPIIDLMAAVDSLAAAERMISEVEALGYVWGRRDRQDVPDRFYFVRQTPDGRMRTHHLSLAEASSGFWKRQLAFRDYLRANPQMAEEYLAVKEALAKKHPNDSGAYNKAKTDFVMSILRLAMGDCL